MRNAFRNLGDEAMLDHEIGRLREAFPDARLVVLTDDPSRLRALAVEADLSDVSLTHPFASSTARNLRRGMAASTARMAPLRPLLNRVAGATTRTFLRLAAPVFLWNARRVREGKKTICLVPQHRRLLGRLQEADIVVAGGGLVPTDLDIFGPRVTLLRALELLGRPVVLHGLSVLERDRRDGLYRLPARIILRDFSHSRANALSCDVAEARLVDGVDPAFGIAEADPAAVRHELDRIGLDADERGFIAVNLRTSSQRRVDPGLIAAALEQHCRAAPQGRSVLFFGMQDFRNRNDRRILDQVRRLLAPRLRTALWPKPESAALLKGVLARAQCSIVARYHAAVFSLTVGTPAIGLSVAPRYDIKLGGVFDMFGVADFVADIEAVTRGWLLERLEHCTTDRDSLGARLRQARTLLAEYEEAPYRTIGELLEQRSGDNG